jgi:hypothetical protein
MLEDVAGSGRKLDVEAIGIPIVLVKVSYSGLRDEGIEDEASVEVEGGIVELHAGEDTLRGRKISSGERFDLAVLKGSIIVVEAFTTSSSRGGKVSEGLELPVGPACKVLIANGDEVSDLFNASRAVKAGTKLTEEQRDSISSSIH